MREVTEQKVSAWHCESCRRTQAYFDKTCKEKAHRQTKVNAVKRWFECKACAFRDTALNRTLFPTKCPKCQGFMARASMYVDRDRPKAGQNPLQAVTVNPRGKEHAKFLNAMPRAE